jgi:hypothetical protein
MRLHEQHARGTNISPHLFREWYPQIMYNHHQTGPLGTVIFMPPFRDPFNYHYDPLVPLKIEAVGIAMHERLVEENKPGSGMRSTATYSTWYNGGLRTVTYFHNMTGILTEIIGSPTPMQLPFVPAKQLSNQDELYPVAPQIWHFKTTIAYEQTNTRAILDYASREREHLLYYTYRMAKNSIERGNQDSWTITPKRIEALEAEAAKAKPSERAAAPSFENARTAPADLYNKVLHDPAQRDPRGYILSADQPDFPTATKFINALMKSGVEIQQALPTSPSRASTTPKLLHRPLRASLPPPRPRHVRAAGPPQRLRLPRRPTQPPLRRHRLDTRLPDGVSSTASSNPSPAPSQRSPPTSQPPSPEPSPAQQSQRLSRQPRL